MATRFHFAREWHSLHGHFHEADPADGECARLCALRTASCLTGALGYVGRCSTSEGTLRIVESLVVPEREAIRKEAASTNIRKRLAP